MRADQNRPWDNRKKYVTSALESGADAVLVKDGEGVKVRELGRIKVVSGSEDADVRLFKSFDELRGKGVKAFYKVIKSKGDEEEIVSAGGRAEYVVVKASDWKVIPLENLIAALRGKARIIVEVSSLDEARLALETLEVGCEGVLADVKPGDVSRFRDVVDSASTEKLPLSAAEVSDVKQVGMGDRVCVDTCSVFEGAEGMLVGSQSNALFLVHAENIETPYVAQRPFRVNAGPVHAYTRMPDGKTRYLSELSAGDSVLAVDAGGNTRGMVVGRLKIERRPLILVEAVFEGIRFKTILQNAETIRLVSPKGGALSVASLKRGDKVLVYLEDGGRHFGMKVEETIEEK